MGVRMFKDVSCGCFVGRFVCIACADDCDHLCAHVCVKPGQDRQHTHTHILSYTLIPSQGVGSKQGRRRRRRRRRDFRPNEYSCSLPCLRLLRSDAELSRI